MSGKTKRLMKAEQKAIEDAQKKKKQIAQIVIFVLMGLSIFALFLMEERQAVWGLSEGLVKGVSYGILAFNLIGAIASAILRGPANNNNTGRR